MGFHLLIEKLYFRLKVCQVINLYFDTPPFVTNLKHRQTSKQKFQLIYRTSRKSPPPTVFVIGTPPIEYILKSATV